MLVVKAYWWKILEGFFLVARRFRNRREQFAPLDVDEKVVLGFLAFLGVVIAALIVFLATEALGAEPWEWKHFGAAPFAATREEAMAGRYAVFKDVGLPKGAIAQLMLATTSQGETVLIPDRLDWMVSRGGEIHRNVIVKVPPMQRGAESWQVEWEGRSYRIYLPLCYNWCLRTGAAPAEASPPAAAVPAAPALSQYGLQINFMTDRPDGYWRNKYEAAKARREGNLQREDVNKKGLRPYWEVFTQAPFGDMLKERKDRPLDGKFLVRFLKKEPVLDIRSGDSAGERVRKYNEYLRQWQSPSEDNILTGQWVSTSDRGWVIIPITFPLEQFEAVLIQPEQIGQVLEPLIAVHRPEFATQSNPIHVWEVR